MLVQFHILSNRILQIAPYASVIVNGIFWGPKTPRLLTIPDAKHLFTPNVKQSLDVPGCPTLPHRYNTLCLIIIIIINILSAIVSRMHVKAKTIARSLYSKEYFLIQIALKLR